MQVFHIMSQISTFRSADDMRFRMVWVTQIRFSAIDIHDIDIFTGNLLLMSEAQENLFIWFKLNIIDMAIWSSELPIWHITLLQIKI